MSEIPEVTCPTCGKSGDWFSGPFDPFSSKRCRLTDLGKWLGEEYVVPGPLRPEHSPSPAAQPAGGLEAHADGRSA